MGENLTRGLTPEQRERIAEVEELRRRGDATEDDLRERWELLRPAYFADEAAIRPVPPRVGPECSSETNASIAEHFERGTLVDGVPEVELPMLFVAGALDALPLGSIERTAALVPGAVLETIPDCGHFTWWERPRETGRIVGEFLAGNSSECPSVGPRPLRHRVPAVADAVQRWRDFGMQMVEVFEAQGGRSDPAYQGALHMVVLADQVLRILRSRAERE